MFNKLLSIIVFFSIYSPFINATEIQIENDNCEFSYEEFFTEEKLITIKGKKHHKALFGWWNNDKEEEKKDEADTPPFSAEKILNLAQRLKKEIIGQDDAIDTIVNSLINYSANIHSQERPLGSFLFIGPPGTGKTQLAKCLAKEFLGDEKRIIRVDMSNSSAVWHANSLVGESSLFGNGFLTEGLKKDPEAIILLDEIEKAPPRIRKVLLSILDEGRIVTSKHNIISCKKNLIIMTSNLGSEHISEQFDQGYSHDEILKSVTPLLTEEFSPELFNRMDALVFKPFTPETFNKIIDLKLSELSKKIKNKSDITIHFDQTVREYLFKSSYRKASGARLLLRSIEKKISPLLARLLLEQAELVTKKEEASPFHIEIDITTGHHTMLVAEPGDRIISFIRTLSEDGKEEEEFSGHAFRSEKVIYLKDNLKKEIIGQDHAIQSIADSIITYAAGVKDSRGPIASLFFMGPTGTGKTALAQALAKELLGDKNKLIRLDMSQFSARYSVSALLGSGPGYADSDKGGALTNALKKNPSSVILLDEMEKAHPEVQKLFLPLFDEGHISDAFAKKIDCRNHIIIISSNLGGEELVDLHRRGCSQSEILRILQPKLMKALSPELYNRLEPVIFLPLSEEVIEVIVENMLKELKDRIFEKKKISITFDSSVKNYLKKKGFSPKLGARPLRRLINKKILNLIAYSIMTDDLKAGDSLKISYFFGRFSLQKETPQ